MARPTPVSTGGLILVRPVATILPGAVATMSILPKAAQASARQNSAMIVMAMARPIGEGGVSTISSAAGRKASSSRSRRVGAFGNGMTALADFVDATMDATLQTIEGCVAPARAHQLVVRPIFDQPAALKRND